MRGDWARQTVESARKTWPTPFGIAYFGALGLECRFEVRGLRVEGRGLVKGWLRVGG